MYTVADISARERESCQVTKIFNKILIPSCSGDIPIVQCALKIASQIRLELNKRGLFLRVSEYSRQFLLVPDPPSGLSYNLNKIVHTTKLGVWIRLILFAVRLTIFT